MFHLAVDMIQVMILRYNITIQIKLHKCLITSRLYDYSFHRYNQQRVLKRLEI